MIRKHFRLKRIALGLAFAAVAAPAAQATPYVSGSDRVAPEIQSGVNAPTATLHRSVASQFSSQVSPYELGSGRAMHVLPGAMTLVPVVVRSENSFGVPGPSAAGATGPRAVPVVSTPSNGFDWSDAGIGVSAAFGTALVLLISLGLARRNRNRTGLARA